MKLGTKSRAVLELLLMTGLDTLATLASPRSVIMGSGGFESERSFDRILETLRNEGLIEDSRAAPDGKWALDLTQRARDQLLDGLDPERSWSGPWDGRWSVVTFDLPRLARLERFRLDRWLRLRRFGRLQGSVWISHRPCAEWLQQFEQQKIDPSGVVFLRGHPAWPSAAPELAAKAWNFDVINERYAQYLEFLSQPAARLNRSWQKDESRLWSRAFQIDPFLPESLLPETYLGKQAWSQRRDAYRAQARLPH